MGYRLNRLDEPVFMAGPKPMLTEFGIYQRLESVLLSRQLSGFFQLIKREKMNQIAIVIIPADRLNWSSIATSCSTAAASISG